MKNRYENIFTLQGAFEYTKENNDLSKLSNKGLKKLTLKTLNELVEKMSELKPPDRMPFDNWPAMIEFIAYDGKPHEIHIGDTSYEVSVRRLTK